MVLQIVELLGHKVVIGFGDFVEHDGGDKCVIQQFLGVVQVDDAHAGHHGRAVVEGKTLAQGGLQRGDTQLFHHIGGRSAQAFVEHIAFTNQGQGHVRQLNQVARSTHTAMLRDDRTDAFVDERAEQLQGVGINARLASYKGVVTRQHGGLHIQLGKRLASPAGMAADDVVL